MPVYDDIDFIGLEYAEIDAAFYRHGRAEHDVLQFGRNQRAAPAVGNRAAAGLGGQVFIVLINAGVCAVHYFHHFAVDPARG